MSSVGIVQERSALGSTFENRSPDAFQAFLLSSRLVVDSALREWFQNSNERVIEALRYSLLLHSKRIRPIYCLETCRAFTGRYELALPAAMALEMVHTYSLIHDDLPCMDNDDLRRGKPTNHKVYGEATALLAGSALLSAAFEVLAKSGDTAAETRIEWIKELADASGAAGMVLGQQWDMDPVSSPTLSDLAKLHNKKTGALLAASVVMGAQAAGQSTQVIEKLREFALDMGIAFQIRDDVLDVIGGVEIGKPVLSDEKNSKVTYVNLLGLDGAKAEANRYLQSALSKLQTVPFVNSHYLEELTRFVVDRKV
jgi:geranylgeranyl diphosphate synthase type II